MIVNSYQNEMARLWNFITGSRHQFYLTGPRFFFDDDSGPYEFYAEYNEDLGETLETLCSRNRYGDYVAQEMGKEFVIRMVEGAKERYKEEMAIKDDYFSE